MRTRNALWGRLSATEKGAAIGGDRAGVLLNPKLGQAIEAPWPSIFIYFEVRFHERCPRKQTG